MDLAENANIFAQFTAFDLECSYALLVLVSATRRRGAVKMKWSVAELLERTEQDYAMGIAGGLAVPAEAVDFLVARYISPICAQETAALAETPMFPAFA